MSRIPLGVIEIEFGEDANYSPTAGAPLVAPTSCPC